MFRINLYIKDEGIALLTQFGNRNKREVSPLSPGVSKEKVGMP